MAKSKVVKDALVEEEKVKKSKKEEIAEETKETEKKDKKAIKAEKKAAKKEKKEQKVKDKKDGVLKSTYKEMKKVSWPSFGEVMKYSLAVILFCLVLIGFFKVVELLAAYLKMVMS